MRLVFWGLVIAGLVVLGVRWLAGQGRGEGRDETLDILRQRYARGEIDGRSSGRASLRDERG